MARPIKRPEGLRKATQARHRNRVNALLWAKVRIVNEVPDEDIKEGLMERYGYAERSAIDLIKRARIMAEYVQARDAEKIINKNLQRLDAIAEAAADGDDYANALKAIDTLNKMSGAYVEKKEISVEGNNITFKFGNEE